MDHPLRNALDELRKYGAKNIPSASQAEKVVGGSQWSGITKEKNGHWRLIKHKSGSYNVHLGKYD